uniref:Uncharacterized protein n=1 Tax=Rhizophora mucronata TaxID=61149 RepID=A0A2P2QPZ3_RHIMU
MLADIIRR